MAVYRYHSAPWAVPWWEKSFAQFSTQAGHSVTACDNLEPLHSLRMSANERWELLYLASCMNRRQMATKTAAREDGRARETHTKQGRELWLWLRSAVCLVGPLYIHIDWLIRRTSLLAQQKMDYTTVYRSQPHPRPSILYKLTTEGLVAGCGSRP